MQALSLAEYNAHISIPPPRLDDFDVRNFARNMETVHLKVSPFRLGFNQIALLESGGGRVGSDGRDYDLANCTLFFNLTNQIVYWEVERDWRGYYCNLPEAGYTLLLPGYPTLADLPYFRHSHPGIHLDRREALEILETFRRLDRIYLTPATAHYRLRLLANTAVLLTQCLVAYERYAAEERERTNRLGTTDRFLRLVRERASELAMGLSVEPLRAGSAAAALFVTPGHLAECTRRDLGRTPSSNCFATERRWSGSTTTTRCSSTISRRRSRRQWDARARGCRGGSAANSTGTAEAQRFSPSPLPKGPPPPPRPVTQAAVPCSPLLYDPTRPRWAPPSSPAYRDWPPGTGRSIRPRTFPTSGYCGRRGGCSLAYA